MTIKADIVKALLAVGVTKDQIVDAQLVLADEARAKERTRKAIYRKSLREGAEKDGTMSHVSQGQTGQKEKFPHTPSKEKYISPSQPSFPLVDIFNNSARARSKPHANGHDHGDFEDFWLAYPNKVGKADARKAFDRALKRASIEVIADGLRRYCDKTDDRPWCHPSTWLNQDRWLDEPALPPPKRQTPQQERRDEVRRVAEEMISEARERSAKRA